jgi:hypothetical protein
MRRRLVQTPLVSFTEAVLNVSLGYVLALLTQRLVYPAFGISTTLATDCAIAGVFTLVSLARSFLVRRLFEQLE